MNNLYAKRLASLALCGVLVVGVGQARADVDPQVAEQPVKKKLSRKERNKRDGVECKRVRETGSRVKKKVCTTAVQREALARQERAKIDAIKDRSVSITPLGN